MSAKQTGALFIKMTSTLCLVMMYIFYAPQQQMLQSHLQETQEIYYKGILWALILDF